jgi:hypothetical protein
MFVAKVGFSNALYGKESARADVGQHGRSREGKSDAFR